jgi:DNA polymerase III gamma/tau subunit
MNSNEPQMTVTEAVTALVAEMVTNRDSVLAMLIHAVRGAARDLEQLADDAIAASGPGACEHDAPAWVTDVCEIGDALRYAAAAAESNAQDVVDTLHAAGVIARIMV